MKCRTPELLLDLMLPLSPARTLDVLDLGCGTGLFGPKLRPFARTLTGIDLSSNMLRLAAERHVYDSLIHGDLIEYLLAQAKQFDVVMAADVFVYIGDLSRVFRGVRGALRDGGFFGFSAEISDQQDFVLRSNLKYGHSSAYLRRLAGSYGFSLESIVPRVLRQDGGNDVKGHVVGLRAT